MHRGVSMGGHPPTTDEHTILSTGPHRRHRRAAVFRFFHNPDRQGFKSVHIGEYALQCDDGTHQHSCSAVALYSYDTFAGSSNLDRGYASCECDDLANDKDRPGERHDSRLNQAKVPHVPPPQSINEYCNISMFLPTKSVVGRVHGGDMNLDLAMLMRKGYVSEPRDNLFPLSSCSAQSARFLWCSVSKAFRPNNLSEGDVGINSVTKDEVSAHGFDIVYKGYFTMEKEFKDRRTGELHPTLIAVRAWFHSTIYGRTVRTFPPGRFEKPNTWVAFARNTTDVDQVIASHMGGPPAPMA